MKSFRSKELHRTGRRGWLRAAVLGANDGIVSTASLVLGVAAAHGTHNSIMVAGVAGLVAGAMSIASAASFAVGAALPLLVTAVVPVGAMIALCLEPLWPFWRCGAGWRRTRVARG
jgi:VIT1/CCC1 family predicted Fe2+/Mn2+ transporter